MVRLIKKLNPKYVLLFFILLLLAGIVAVYLIVSSGNVPVLEPRGEIADKQRDLIVFATLLSLLIVIPVFALTFFIAWKYRAGNKKAKYAPDWDHNRVIESLWWGIPIALIFVLAVVAWKSSHELDPYKQLSSEKKPLTVQVVALQWKWLFIYPQQNIASVNFVQFPVNTPVNFEITSDAPMNSFWIPSLGGQVYAMSGMRTKLHLNATEVGEFTGSSANISGKGFSGMKFVAKSSTPAEFEKWVEHTKMSGSFLDTSSYNKLAKPSENESRLSYWPVEDRLFDNIMMKYMGHGHPSRNIYSENETSSDHPEGHSH